MRLPEKVQIVEVSPRDGFQNICDWIPTELKLEVIDGLIKANIKRLEITSFVHPKAIPQMKDAKEITKQAMQKYSHINFNALVPNLYGAKAAWEVGVREVTYVISASEKHNKANVNRTIDESFAELKELTQQLPEIFIKLDIATAFGCPYGGEVPITQLLSMIDKSMELKIDEICLCDTIGVANPRQVFEVIKEVKASYPNLNFGLHLHDTEGMGLANVLVALQCGVTNFETALGGLGGCPFAPGAAGNLATEDLVNMLEKMGITTNINLERLLETVNLLKRKIKPDLTGHLSHAISQCN